MLLINCYTCPIYKNKQIQAHDIRQNEVIKSYSKMPYDNINLFASYNNAVSEDDKQVYECEAEYIEQKWDEYVTNNACLYNDDYACLSF